MIYFFDRWMEGGTILKILDKMINLFKLKQIEDDTYFQT